MNSTTIQIFLLLILRINSTSLEYPNSHSFDDEKPRVKRQHSLTAKPAKSNQQKVVDFSDNSEALPDDDGEYTGATLLKDSMNSFPSSFTICTSYMVKGGATGYRLLTLSDQDRQSWTHIKVDTFSTLTGYNVYIDKVFFSVTIETPIFPLDWSHYCLSLNSDSGMIRLVVDGAVLEEKVHEHALEVDVNRPSTLILDLGFRSQGEYSGETTNLNIFSSALSREIMERMTGGEECGAEGDYLSWEEAHWSLYSKAKLKMVVREEPCKTESKIQMYYGHSRMKDCMHHCQKLGRGRSPPLRALLELEIFRKELHSLSPDNDKGDILWLAATNEQVESEWRDYYTEERLNNYKKPWYAVHDTKYGSSHNCMRPDNAAWGETLCSDESAPGCPCQFSRRPVLHLRGLCGDSFLDTHYSPKHLPLNSIDLIFLGTSSTRITFDNFFF